MAESPQIARDGVAGTSAILNVALCLLGKTGHADRYREPGAFLSQTIWGNSESEL